MRRLLHFSAVVSALMACLDIAAFDFTGADALFSKGEDYAGCASMLESMLTSVPDSHVKSEVLWRLSRVYLMIGQGRTSVESKREAFGKGIAYAEDGKRADPANYCNYMWHCANIGRDCQTRSIAEQARKVSVMTDDLTAIIEKLGRTDVAEAWQALGEIYINHPLKSNEAAINFGRKAVNCIPDGQPWISTYCFLARALYDRNWSASKRKSSIDSNHDKFLRKGLGNIDKYSYFDGSLGSDYVPVWSDRPLGQMSDREEAIALFKYSESLYRNSPHTKSLSDQYDEFEQAKSSWK